MTYQVFWNTYPVISAIILFLLFTVIGSFLNVVIYRYPIQLQQEWTNDCLLHLNQTHPPKKPIFNLWMPRSHCTHCKKTLKVWMNIPLLSYIFLGGKCGFCKKKIALQYFIVELATALFSLVVFFLFGFTYHSLVLLLFTWGLIVLSFIDVNHQFLPDPIIYILLWMGLIISTHHYFISDAQAIMGSVIGYLFLWIISKFYFLIRNEEGLGLGDCKMLAMIGAWVGPLALLNVLLFSCCLAIIVSFILLLTKKIQFRNPIPFGPYIALAGWWTLLFGDQITQWLAQWVT